MNRAIALLILECSLLLSFTSAGDYSPPALQRDPSAQFEFHGFVGQRVQANIRHWLIPAPAANPGMLEMFQLRDRIPKPNLVPWAGEFVGKYLISAVQAMRMSNDPELKQVVSEVVRKLISSQAEDGYLGPFPKAERLLGHWDLWGHYHCILALLSWHELTGDSAALDCAKRAGDLVCNTFLDTGRRALDAKSDEMNLSIIHSLGWLFRLTGHQRYQRMMLEIVQDWEKAGDYLRTGLDSVEFYQTPRPRWESLHNLQGLVELDAIQKHNQYRRAFEHHWRSIARFDIRNSGGFSSGEQATGNPYSPTTIETCCTIAWMALSTDMLRLTGDSRVADFLELSTFNAWAGAQHPSGRWCTYNTPMDGIREASAHTIVFQARQGSPELNCCSVNGPRGWGMLVDWALMKTNRGLVLNWLGPANYKTQVDSTHPVTLHVTGNYPVDPRITITLDPATEVEFTLLVRVPEWSRRTEVRINQNVPIAAQAGSYFPLKRKWKKGDTLALTFDLGLRVIPGDREQLGNISLYRGPILLAYDQKFNSFDPSDIPVLPIQNFLTAKTTDSRHGQFEPIILLQLQDGQKRMQLCDFASAGASGTHYRSWFKPAESLPPTVVTRQPPDGKKISRGMIAFRWTGPRKSDFLYDLQISDGEDFQKPILQIRDISTRETLVAVDERFREGSSYYWQVLAKKSGAHALSTRPPARFQVDPNLPLLNETLQPPTKTGPAGELLLAPLNETPSPTLGQWQSADGWKSQNGAIALNGIDQRLVYTIGEWPAEDYTLTLKFRVMEFPLNRLGQVFSAWAAGMDDPLRVCVQDGKLFARIEAGAGFSTDGVSIEPNRWYHLRVLKQGTRLTLFLDEKERASCTVPAFISSQARDFALGGNPHYPGHEFLAVEVSDLRFYGDALHPGKP